MAGISIRACEQDLRENPRTWLVTGVAGFIGSNLLERLLRLDQKVVGLDNLSTGHAHNLDAVREQVSHEQWQRFHFLKGDIRDLELCRQSTKGADFVLHQAALGSVPRSLLDPMLTHENNLTGFLNVLIAARDMRVRRFVYASSSSVYGDHPDLPKVEENTGMPLSPYAVTKCADELYAMAFAHCYDMQVIGLRYFNVFGPRQDPEGAYAAVIPLWFKALLNNEPVYINGDGETSRDFCYVDNAVQANLLAAWVSTPEAMNRIYNVAVGERTTLLQLYQLIRAEVSKYRAAAMTAVPHYRDFRPGDIRHSLADISKARQLLGYDPVQRVTEGLVASSHHYMHLFDEGIAAD